MRQNNTDEKSRTLFWHRTTTELSNAKFHVSYTSYGTHVPCPMCASTRRLVLCVKTRITTRALNAIPYYPVTRKCTSCGLSHMAMILFFSVEKQTMHESTREEHPVEFMPVVRKPRRLKPVKSSSLTRLYIKFWPRTITSKQGWKRRMYDTLFFFRSAISFRLKLSYSFLLKLKTTIQ